MKTINNCSTNDLIEMVATWKEMTENNEHSELLCDMAIFFDLAEYCNYFFDLTFKDHLTMKESEERYAAKENMLSTIKSNYGETIYNLIQKAF